jgi:hypothetical protein
MLYKVEVVTTMSTAEKKTVIIDEGSQSINVNYIVRIRGLKVTEDDFDDFDDYSVIHLEGQPSELRTSNGGGWIIVKGSVNFHTQKVNMKFRQINDSICDCECGK